jgi:hypothetical protein
MQVADTVHVVVKGLTCRPEHRTTLGRGRSGPSKNTLMGRFMA